MKLAIAIRDEHSWWRSLSVESRLVYIMSNWLTSKERDTLIAFEVPFLFIGYQVSTIRTDCFYVCIDVVDRLAGVAKVCLPYVTEVISSAHFVDLRVDHIRERFADGALKELEAGCSYERTMQVYTVKSWSWG